MLLVYCLFGQNLPSWMGHAGFSLDTPYEDLSPAAQRVILHGTGDAWLTVAQPAKDGVPPVRFQYKGVLPTISEAGNKPMRPWITVEGVYVAAPSKNKDAAYELAKYLTDVPAARIMALEGRQTPANKGVYADPAVANDPILKAFRQQVDVAVPMPNLPEMSMVWSPAWRIASIWRG